MTVLQPEWPAPFGVLELRFDAPCTVAAVDARNLTCVVSAVDVSAFVVGTCLLPSTLASL